MSDGGLLGHNFGQFRRLKSKRLVAFTKWASSFQSFFSLVMVLSCGGKRIFNWLQTSRIFSLNCVVLASEDEMLDCFIFLFAVAHC